VQNGATPNSVAPFSSSQLLR